MTHVRCYDVKIKEKVYSPTSNKVTYTMTFTADLWDDDILSKQIENAPLKLSVVTTDAIENMSEEIHRLRDELDEKDNFITSLKEAAKILIKAASMEVEE